MGYKGTKIRKKAPQGHISLSTFPQNVACLLWQHFIRCGNCPDTLQDCQIFWSSLFRCGSGLYVLCQWPFRKRRTGPPFSPVTLALTVSIHFYLFVSRKLWMFVESRQKLQQKTGCRPLWDTLFPIYWVPWQFSVRALDSVLIWPSLGLALGPCALFHILYDVYTCVYSCLLPPLFEPFFNPCPLFCVFSRPPFNGRLVLPSSYSNVCVVGFFHTKCTVIWKKILFHNIIFVSLI